MKPVRLSLHNALAVFSAFALALLTASFAYAQTGSSSLRGTITDTQGRAVAGAQVTITNEQKNFSRTQTTNDDGAYTFTSIPPGTYRLEVQATGFKKAQVSEVLAQIDTPGTFDVQMEVSGYHHNVAGDFLSLRPAIFVAGRGQAAFRALGFRALTAG